MKSLFFARSLDVGSFAINSKFIRHQISGELVNYASVVIRIYVCFSQCQTATQIGFTFYSRLAKQNNRFVHRAAGNIVDAVARGE